MLNLAQNRTLDEDAASDRLWYGDGWKTCSARSLRTHLVSVHFDDPCAVVHDGVARWDIELAAYRGLDLTWVVSRIYDFLERSDADIEDAAGHPGNLKNYSLHERPPITAHEYRVGLVRNLLYIEQLEMAAIDWPRVERALIGARSVDIDLRSASESFFAEKRIPHSMRRYRSERAGAAE